MNKKGYFIIFFITIMIIVQLIISLKIQNSKLNKLNEINNSKEMQAVMKCNDNETVDFFTHCVAWELNKEE